MPLDVTYANYNSRPSIHASIGNACHSHSFRHDDRSNLIYHISLAKITRSRALARPKGTTLWTVGANNSIC